MILEQFVSPDNLDKFLASDEIKKYLSNTITSTIGYDKIFDSFVDPLVTSKYGSMINMFLGGKDALEGLRQPFIEV